jgi:hypothetical protein
MELCGQVQTTDFVASDRSVCAGRALLDCPAGRDTMPEFKIGQYVYYVPRKAEGRYVEANPNPNASTLPRQPSFAGSRVGDEPGPKRHLYIETKLIRSALLCHLSF